MYIGVVSDENLSVLDFKWFEDLHRVMKGRVVVPPVHLLDSANPGDLPSPAASGVPQEEDDDEECVPLESSAEVQTWTPTHHQAAAPPTHHQAAALPPPHHQAATLPSSRHQAAALPPPRNQVATLQHPAAEGPPKQKRKKITKVEKVEKTANEILERVLKEHQVLVKYQEEELEKKRCEEKKAESESERDTKFVEILGQLISEIRPQQGPHAFATPYPPPPQYPPVPPMPRLPPQQAPVSFDPYDPMYMYPAPNSEEEEED